ncbi:MAG: FabA/FabZ family ACP-dehydratase [Gammaproteobacteria bacterium]
MNFLEFNMIDRVITLDKDQKSIVCSTQVPEQSFIFDAHFPGFPVLPGVFMIETIAQAAGWLSLSLTEFKKMAFLFGVEDTRFRDFVPPNSLLEVRVKIVQQGSGYAVAEGEIIHQNKIIANAEVRLRLAPVPNNDIKSLLKNRAESMGIDTKVNDALPA